MDESFQKENNIIQQIQEKMVQYFLGRSGKLAQDGISGLLDMTHFLDIRKSTNMSDRLDPCNFCTFGHLKRKVTLETYTLPSH